MKIVKTRFAPSPTGYLHIGSLRTALYCYLFARKHQGIFALRIEDTDQNRFVEGATENLMEILEIFGLQWDEGPIFQSKRTEVYQGYAQELLQKGRAYKCYCRPEDLEAMRAEQVAKGKTPKYDGRCSHLSEAEHEAHFKAGKNFVIRLKMPQSILQFDDAIRGHVEFHGKDIDDQVLIKSDGFPTYHLANVVDDHEMEITHVIRGEEWLSSTPKHIALYDAFGWDAPQFAHLPLLLNSDRSKLSKRQGDVAAEDYLKKGYLPKAILNFIAFQGWNPGTEKEFFTIEELIEAFDLDRVQKAGAVFTVEKLDWYNGHYLREMPLLELAEHVRLACLQASWWPQSFAPTLTKEDLEKESRPEASDFLRYTACIQSRMKTLQDSAPMMKSFFLKDFSFDRALFLNEKMGVDAGAVTLGLEQSLACLQQASHETFASENALKELLVRTIKSLGIKNGVLLWPLRIALSNEMYSPGATEMLHILGQKESLRRLEKALEFWKN